MKLRDYLKNGKITSLIIAALITSQSFTTAYADSYGIIDSTDPSGAKVVIDADDIQQNAAAINQIQRQLQGLEGKTLQWSDAMGTYVIVTYETDEDGNILYDDNGQPKVKSEEPIGALGTADPRMVVENRSFSSLYAKGQYEDTNSAKQPGVDQNGTLVDVLQNGWGPSQLTGTPYYAVSDTFGTETSRREKNSSATGTSSLLPASKRTSQLAVDTVEYTDNGSKKTGTTESIPKLANNSGLTLDHGQYSSADSSDKYSLSSTQNILTLGINESVTLPAGYYSKQVTLNNGVVNQTNTGEITVTDTVPESDTKSTNKTASAGNKKITIENGTYPISDFNTTTKKLALGAEGKVTLPAGYYAQDIQVENSSKDILSGRYATYSGPSDFNPASGTSTSGNISSYPEINELDPDHPIILGINKQITMPAGYYSKQVTIQNGTVNMSRNGKFKIYDTVRSADPEEDNKTASAGNKYVTLANNDPEDPDDGYAIDDFNTTTRTLALGAEGKVKIPAGYYDKDILVENTSKDILSGNYATYTTPYDYNPAIEGSTAGDTSSYPEIDTLNATTPIILANNKGITLPAGYYSEQVTIKNGTVNQTRNGSIKVTNTVDTIDDKADNKTPSAGNKNITLANNNLEDDDDENDEYKISIFNTTTRPISLGAEGKTTIPAGYYSNDILIENTAKDILSGNYASYTEPFDYNPAIAGSTAGDTSSYPEISDLDPNHPIVLANNKGITLPAGYYSKQVKIENGTVNQTRNGQFTVVGTDLIDGPEVNTTITKGNRKDTTTNGSHDIKNFGSDTADALYLGANGKVTIPAGYYSKDILIENSAKNLLTGSYSSFVETDYAHVAGTTGAATMSELKTKNYVLDANKKITLPAGYYNSSITVANGVVDQTTTGKITVAGTIGNIDGNANNKTNTAGNKNISLANGEHNIDDIGNATRPLSLGAGASATLPAGYYHSSIKVENSVKDVLSDGGGMYTTADNTQSANAATSAYTKMSELKTKSLIVGIDTAVTLPAGYYSSQVTIKNGIRNRTRNDKFQITGTVGSIDSGTTTAASGNMKGTLSNTSSATYAFNTYKGANKINLGANAQVTIPAGYYSDDFTVASTVKNILAQTDSTFSETGYAQASTSSNITSGTQGNPSGFKMTNMASSAYTLSVDKKVTFPAGYYSQTFTVANGVVDVLARGVKATVDTYSNGNNNSLTAGTYAIASGIGNNQIGNLNLGVDQKITLPAGYYSSAIVVKNGVKDRGNLTKTLSPGTYQDITAGYYSGGRITAQANSGTFQATERKANVNMGDTVNYKYVDTTGVPNNNDNDTVYSFPYGSKGTTITLAKTHNYYKFEATEVYNQGLRDGATDHTATKKLTVPSNPGVSSSWTSVGSAGDLNNTHAIRYVDASPVYNAGYNNGKSDGVSETKKGNADKAQVLEGYTFTNNTTVGESGSMKNNGELNPAALSAGTSYTIPAGYTSGGTVTAKDLASQTQADAEAKHILSGHTAWVNGTKIEGTRPGGTAIRIGYTGSVIDIKPIYPDYGSLTVDNFIVNCKGSGCFIWDGNYYSPYSSTCSLDLSYDANNGILYCNENYPTEAGATLLWLKIDDIWLVIP